MIFANVIQCEGRCTAYMTALRDSGDSMDDQIELENHNDEQADQLYNLETTNVVLVLATVVLFVLGIACHHGAFSTVSVSSLVNIKQTRSSRSLH